jgi:hypothetical protein
MVTSSASDRGLWEARRGRMSRDSRRTGGRACRRPVMVRLPELARLVRALSRTGAMYGVRPLAAPDAVVSETDETYLPPTGDVSREDPGGP